MTTTSCQDATVWSRLAAPVPLAAIQWRQDGKPVTRDGQSRERQVAYIEAGTVRERLDAIVPGEWNLHLEPLPPIDADGGRLYAFRARLSVLGVEREDVGQGKDYKAASTDAFKRAAVRFGIGHELYELPVKGGSEIGSAKSSPSRPHPTSQPAPQAAAAAGTTP